jgi:hypothetical protein
MKRPLALCGVRRVFVMDESCRFVVLTHDHPVLHWDLMLERGDVLRTWRLAEEPLPGVAIAAEALADHRRKYLDYEGPVTGDRGTVVRWDAGTFCEWLETADVVTAVVDGARIKGTITIRKSAEDTCTFLLHPLTPTGE